MFNKCVTLLVSMTLCMLVLGPATDAQAAVANWTGTAGDALWSTPENWTLWKSGSGRVAILPDSGT